MFYFYIPQECWFKTVDVMKKKKVCLVFQCWTMNSWSRRLPWSCMKCLLMFFSLWVFLVLAYLLACVHARNFSFHCGLRTALILSGGVCNDRPTGMTSRALPLEPLPSLCTLFAGWTCPWNSHTVKHNFVYVCLLYEQSASVQ